MKILVLNSGSSSLKYQLIDTKTEEMLAKGYYERIGTMQSFLTHKVAGIKHKTGHYAPNYEVAIKVMLDQLLKTEYKVIDTLDEIDAIGHRVVHGGEKISKPVIITEEVENIIRECIPLAPLHNPAALLGIEACKKVMPGKPMVAVFDTAFHQTIPSKRYIYPIPYKYYEKYGIRKYGFHGTSHEYCARRVAELIGKPVEELKIVNCHLGQGASVCAIENGKSVETSMGLTPLGGISMGSRSGDLDPSVVTYLMEKEHLSTDQINFILNKESGLFGISEISPDARDIEAEAWNGHNQKAQLALDNYHYLVAAYIARCAVAMNGIDVLTFTAGTGEKGPETREEICKQLEFLGLKLDLEANNIKAVERKISSEESKVEVYIVPTNEELMIAEETENMVKQMQ